MYSKVMSIVTCWLFNVVQASYFPLSSQFQLIDTEPKLIDTLQLYLAAENQRLDDLRKFCGTLIREKEAYQNEDKFVWNPLAIFKTVRHLTIDLKNVEKYMEINSYGVTIPKIMEQKNIHIPQDNDMYYVTRNLINLQRVYNFNISEMAAHLPKDSNYLALSSEDCLYIGKIFANKGDYEAAIHWLRGCEDIFDEEELYEAAKIIKISSYIIGNKRACKKAVEKMLVRQWHSRILQDLLVTLNNELGDISLNESDHWNCIRTCAGDYEDEMILRNLKCLYNHHNSPFLTIAPLKEEILSFYPRISIFREVVYDSEIETLKAHAYNLFETASVVKGQNRVRVSDVDYRPSQTAFVENYDLKYYNLYKRLEYISTLSLKKSEKFQMLHYAPGGFYRVHADYLPSYAYDIPEKGNRVATALMYLNDVLLGGSTVFPRLKIRVTPVKGSVLLWPNMRRDGSEEELSRHAACPVVYGEKIACTQWFRFVGQSSFADL